MQARKTLLFDNNEPWVKKSGDSNFDVPMGCFDGAELSEITGTYMLHQISNVLQKTDVGLYRDDGLGILRNMSGPQMDRKRKQLIKIFKECGLSVVVQVNLKTVDFLDVHFDLNNGTYKPYRKPNNNPIYINKYSNHPPNILKDIPKSVNKRIADISSNQEIFENAIPIYKEALKNSGFNCDMHYTVTTPDATPTQTKKNKRKRKILWFNPPFSANVKTNVGKIFFKLLRKHFPKNHQFYKIFNKNTVKISYSCMKNMGSVISSHNQQILRPKATSFGCNCRGRNKANCPLEGKCLTPHLIYQADVTNNIDDEYKFYYGLTETTFKERYNNHTKSFRHFRYETETELSKYIWKLTQENKIPTIKWKIIQIVYSKVKLNFCKLCLTEKYYILNALGNPALLNKRSEFISSCRHKNKLLLKNVKDSKD